MSDEAVQVILSIHQGWSAAGLLGDGGEPGTVAMMAVMPRPFETRRTAMGLLGDGAARRWGCSAMG